MRDLSDAIDELSRDRDDAGEHEDAISRKAISGDAEIWTEPFASRLRDPGEPISRSKAGFERFRAIDANSRATCATPATSFFSPLLLCRAVTALARATPSFAPVGSVNSDHIFSGNSEHLGSPAEASGRNARRRSD